MLWGTLTAPSPQDWEQRQDEDMLLIERILLLVRNVLHIPPDPTEEQVPGWGPSLVTWQVWGPGNPPGTPMTHLLSPLPTAPPRAWMAMPVCTTGCCGRCT